MTSTTPVSADEPTLPALTGDELPATTPPVQQVSVGLLPLALIIVILLLFIVAAWTLLAAGG